MTNLGRMLFFFCLSVGALLVPACSGEATVADLCDKSCECSGCDETERAQCESDSNDVLDEARREGCEEVMSALVDCYVDETACIGGQLDKGDACGAEQNEAQSCVCVGLLGNPARLGRCLQ